VEQVRPPISRQSCPEESSQNFHGEDVMKKIVTPLVLAIGLVTLGGCASVSKEELDAVKATASKAAADAAAAKSAADGAAAAAAQAQSTADAAKSSADQANACCRDTQTKIDRMFKRSMYK
jgi:murein lipoprotein